MGSVQVIAIDGPSGSGKGTISRLLAARLGWHLLDSGALYRLVALAAEAAQVPLNDESKVASVAAALDARFAHCDGEEQVFLVEQDVTAALRTEDCGLAASKLAAMPAVRAALLTRQRAFATPPGLIADGRDMGTVVFPDALLKIFLTASAEERAIRRHKQLKEKGINVSLRDLSGEIAQRDHRDTNRPVAPLRPAGGARVIDSTLMSPLEVMELIESWLHSVEIGTKQD